MRNRRLNYVALFLHFVPQKTCSDLLFAHYVCFNYYYWCVQARGFQGRPKLLKDHTETMSSWQIHRAPLS